MWLFIGGFLTGAIVGMMLMALMVASGRSDDRESD